MPTLHHAPGQGPQRAIKASNRADTLAVLA
jgi:hypothetical protein